MRRPQPLALDLLLQWRRDLGEGASPLGGTPRLVERLEREDLVTDELLHPVESLLEFRVGLEVPCHLWFTFRSLRTLHHAVRPCRLSETILTSTSISERVEG